MSGSLVSLKEIGDEAKNIFPVIKTHMENLVKESNDFIKKSTAKLSRLVNMIHSKRRRLSL